MGRKVFISFLGEGAYLPVKYNQGKSDLQTTRFIQSATLEYLGASSWEQGSEAIILLTDVARRNNWNDCTERLYQGNPIPYNGLRQELESKNFAFAIKDVSIPDGNDENEMFDIFLTLFTRLRDHDELYFDMTHGFRYLPMFLLVLSNYAELVREDIQIRHMSYGNIFTANKEIMDLMPLYDLQKWTIGASDFVKNGSIADLVELSNAEILPLLRLAKGTDKNAKNIKGFTRKLEDVINNLKMCRCKEVIEGRNMKQMRQFAAKIDTTSNIKAFSPIIDRILESLEEFSSEYSLFNGFAAANWCVSKNLYQQAISYLEETVISFFCSKFGIDIYDVEKRTLVASCFTIVSQQMDESKWNVGRSEETKEENLALAKFITSQIPQELACKYCSMAEIRNDVNHVGMRCNSQSAESIKKSIRMYVEYFTEFAKNEYAEQERTKGLFVNFTNHPSESWTIKQLMAAQQYGQLIDLPFPNVDRDSSEQGIQALVDEYINKINRMSLGRTCTIHIMGEMTFTYAMVQDLKSRGYTCVASTSERIVEELPNGVKNVRFEFCKFREY